MYKTLSLLYTAAGVLALSLLASKKKDKERYTEVTQTSKEFKTKVSTVENYMTFSPEGLEIGKSNKDMPVNLSKTEITFSDAGENIFYINSKNVSAEEFFNYSPGPHNPVKKDTFSNNHEHIVHDREPKVEEDQSYSIFKKPIERQGIVNSLEIFKVMELISKVLGEENKLYPFATKEGFEFRTEEDGVVVATFNFKL